MHDWLPVIFFGLLALLLATATLIDIRTFRIPNWLNFILFVIGLLFAIIMMGQVWWKPFAESGIVFLLFYVFSRISYRFKNTTAFGMGDVKFITAITPWAGIISIPWIVTIASIVAILWFSVLSGGQWGKLKNTHIPFGPFLTFAVLLVTGIEQVTGDNLFNSVLTDHWWSSF